MWRVYKHTGKDNYYDVCKAAINAATMEQRGRLGQLVVTPEVVVSQINNTKENKSPGVDGIYKLKY